MSVTALSLDIATRTGWCVIGPNGLHDGGALSFEPRGKNLSTIERHCRIFDSFGTWLVSMCDAFEPDVIVIEDYVIRFAKSAAVSLGLRAQVLVIAHRREIAIDAMAPSEWRRVAKTLGWRGEKSDESDAAWLCASWFAAQRVES